MHKYKNIRCFNFISNVFSIEDEEEPAKIELYIRTKNFFNLL